MEKLFLRLNKMIVGACLHQRVPRVRGKNSVRIAHMVGDGDGDGDGDGILESIMSEAHVTAEQCLSQVLESSLSVFDSLNQCATHINPGPKRDEAIHRMEQQKQVD